MTRYCVSGGILSHSKIREREQEWVGGGTSADRFAG